MTEPARHRPTAELLLLAAIVLAGGALRLTGLDWDGGHHLHPDERFLTMVTEAVRLPGSLAEYLATESSRLNPVNVGHPFFVYGTLPVLIVKSVAVGLGMDTYAEITIVGRVMSSLFDIGTILLTWWIGRRIGGGGVSAGLTAAALLAFSAISIQNAHFYTVDSTAAFFAAAALASLIELGRGRGTGAYVAFGLTLGLAVACRVNLALIALFFPVAVLSDIRETGRPMRRAAALVGLSVLLGAASLRLAHPYAFSGPGLLDVTLAPAFVENMAQVREMVTGGLHFPPANQWIGRTPFLYPAWNLFVWGLGPAWGIAAAVGTVFSLWRGRGRLIAAVGACVFLYHAGQFVPTLRYFLPLVPAFAVVAALWLVHGAARGRWARGLVLTATALWAFAFTAIYRVEHSRVTASRWLLERLSPGDTVAVEHWDDALPLPVSTPESGGPVRRVILPVFDDDTEDKRDALLAGLDAADYVVLSSARAYGSIPRSPWRYPMTTRYYELLFGGELGFRLEGVFTSYPRLGPFRIVDDAAEEQFTVYDHPKVLVFSKQASYSSASARALLEAVVLDDIVRLPPRDASRLYRTVWPAPVGGTETSPAFFTDSMTAALAWAAVFELNALALFAILFPACRAAADRGLAFAKVLGFLAPGYLVFLLASLRLAPADEPTIRSTALFVWAVGLIAAWRNRGAMARFFRAGVRPCLAVQAVFWGSFVLFAVLRALNPAVFWGEKPMDFAILNALYRSATLPPADPWLAGLPLNYYYFGHWLVASMGRLLGVPPAIAFNLGLASLAALTATGVFAAARLLSGPRTASLAAAGAVLLGNLEGVRLWIAEPGRAFDFDYFWRTSRVIEGTINEFPFWSFVFGDLHAHVLALPFDVGLLGMAVLWAKTEAAEEAVRWSSRLAFAAVTAWLAGASAATSPWNLPVATAVPVVCLAAARIGRREMGTTWLEVGVWTGAVAGAARLAFLPFWLRYQRPSFVSIGWESASAPLLDVLSLFGPFLLILVPVLTSRLWRERRPGWMAPIVIVIVVLVAAASFLRSPTTGLFVALALGAGAAFARATSVEARLALGLTVLASAIGATTEIVHVSDRMNTVFKYYLHIWLLFAVAASVLLPSLSSLRWRRLWSSVAAAGAAAALFTSASAGLAFLRHPLAPSGAPTLDGTRYLRRSRPELAEALEWLAREARGAPVVLEAHGPEYGPFSRVSMNTGLPTVLGWERHLMQQGVDPREIDARRSHVRAIYETTRLARAKALMDRYHVDFVVVGPIERETYAADGLDKFERWSAVERVFHNAEVSIYARPGVVRATPSSARAAP